MPNHVSNQLTASKEVLDSLSGPDSAMDFETVVPMPEILKGESATGHIEDWAKIALGVVTIRSLERLHPNPADSFKANNYGAAADALSQSNIIRMLSDGPFPKDFSDADFDLLIKYMTALKKHGHANWYSWSRESWGTKWNAYKAVRKSDTVVTFQTAWSAPMKVIDAISKKFPAEQIRLRWADEDFGCNVGDVTVRNGDVIAGGILENDSAASHALALDLIYGGKVPDEYEMRDGKLVYREDVDAEGVSR